MRDILYIHGANSTPASFNYIRENLSPHTVHNVVYNANDHLIDIINRIPVLTKPYHIIAHSLGGIIGMALSQMYPIEVKSVITMSTPFGGSEYANIMSFLSPFSPYFKNIRSNNPILKDIIHRGTIVPTLNIITTEGQPAMSLHQSDGVVSVVSQKALYSAKHIEVPYNHFEVLLNIETVDIIHRFLEYGDK